MSSIYLYGQNSNKYELLGNVKQIKQTYYSPVKRNGKYVAGLQTKYVNAIDICEFSPNGFMFVKYAFKNNGKYSHTIFNEKGEWIKYTEFTKESKIVSRSEKSFNENGDIEMVITLDSSDEWLDKLTWKYNEKHQCIATISEQRNGDVMQQSEHQWNELGKEIEKKIWSDNKQTLICWEKNKFNEEGKRIGYDSFDSEGKLKEAVEYIYNTENELKGVTKNGKTTDYQDNDDEDEQLEQQELDEFGNWTIGLFKINNEPEVIAIREYTYFNHPSENRILTKENTPLNMAQENNPIPKENQMIHLDIEHWKWILEGSSDGDFDSRRFYTVVNKHMPSKKELSTYQVELGTLKSQLIEHMGAVEIFVDKTEASKYEILYNHFVLYFPRNGYVLVANGIQHIDESNYISEKSLEMEYVNYVQFGEIYLLLPSSACGKTDADFEDELEDYFNICQLEKKPEKPEIMMITSGAGGFSLTIYPVQDNFEIKDLDLHYGNGFIKFHADLMQRFSTQHKGLILFHGEPGTGKTYYIRHLLRNMKTLNKAVIYMPPNMVDHMADPGFMEFISNQVNVFASRGLKCILLIEDAEPLLVARDADTRIQGITNLLNMTDGLLNDMLKLQIICTFNVNLKQLDKALLRPGRLTARKEFTALPAFEANILAHQLGVKFVFNQPATLSEIYSKVKNKETLMHND